MSEGNTGRIEHTTDGGIAGTHPHAGSRTIPVAPTDEDRHNRIVIPLRPVACWGIGDVRFEFDSSFVKPEAEDELQHLATIRFAHREEIGEPEGESSHVYPPLSLFGHADPIGDDAYNKTLSGRRVTAVYALLTRDVARWEELHNEPFGGDDWRAHAVPVMLRALGYPVDGGDDVPRAAIVQFQQDAELDDDGIAGPITRAELFSRYMDRLCGEDLRLDPKIDFLGRGEDPDGKADFQGCSEFNPVLMFSESEQSAFSAPGRQAERNAENLPNRRVLGFLFRPGARVDPEMWPCPRAADSAAGCYRRFWSNAAERRRFQTERRLYETRRDTFACRFYDLLADGSPCERATPILRVRLHDIFGHKMPAVRYRIDAGDGHKGGIADSEGFVVDTANADADGATVYWAPVDPEAEDPEAFFYEMTVFLKLADPDTEEGVRQRLHNLGYRIEREPETNLRTFQAHYDLEITGEIDDQTRSRLREIYGAALDEPAEDEPSPPPAAPADEQRT